LDRFRQFSNLIIINFFDIIREISSLLILSFFVSLSYFLRKNSFEFGKLFAVIFDAGIHGTIEFVDLMITLLEQKDESEAELSHRLGV